MKNPCPDVDVEPTTQWGNFRDRWQFALCVKDKESYNGSERRDAFNRPPSGIPASSEEGGESPADDVPDASVTIPRAWIPMKTR